MTRTVGLVGSLGAKLSFASVERFLKKVDGTLIKKEDVEVIPAYVVAGPTANLPEGWQNVPKLKKEWLEEMMKTKEWIEPEPRHRNSKRTNSPVELAKRSTDPTRRIARAVGVSRLIKPNLDAVDGSSLSSTNNDSTGIQDEEQAEDETQQAKEAEQAQDEEEIRRAKAAEEKAKADDEAKARADEAAKANAAEKEKSKAAEENTKAADKPNDTEKARAAEENTKAADKPNDNEKEKSKAAEENTKAADKPNDTEKARAAEENTKAADKPNDNEKAKAAERTKVAERTKAAEKANAIENPETGSRASPEMEEAEGEAIRAVKQARIAESEFQKAQQNAIRAVDKARAAGVNSVNYTDNESLTNDLSQFRIPAELREEDTAAWGTIKYNTDKGFLLVYEEYNNLFRGHMISGTRYPMEKQAFLDKNGPTLCAQSPTRGGGKNDVNIWDCTIVTIAILWSNDGERVRRALVVLREPGRSSDLLYNITTMRERWGAAVVTARLYPEFLMRGQTPAWEPPKKRRVSRNCDKEQEFLQKHNAAIKYGYKAIRKLEAEEFVNIKIEAVDEDSGED
ncbi:uncharacterized protein FTOL_06880 [Fusarium torulosum]|uniref:BRCT domain-containing protein n=1 Tax=Fusarium torulosum TaxID=33205 RepID=A0AAE8MA11_9HYPO|nr:uncharacterized protein FTOL_06880 [Fusarium torulosum]